MKAPKATYRVTGQASRGRQGGGKAPGSTYSHTAAPQAVYAAVSSFASLKKAALPSPLPLSYPLMNQIMELIQIKITSVFLLSA